MCAMILCWNLCLNVISNICITAYMYMCVHLSMNYLLGWRSWKSGNFGIFTFSIFLSFYRFLITLLIYTFTNSELSLSLSLMQSMKEYLCAFIFVLSVTIVKEVKNIHRVKIPMLFPVQVQLTIWPFLSASLAFILSFIMLGPSTDKNKQTNSNFFFLLLLMDIS